MDQKTFTNCCRLCLTTESPLASSVTPTMVEDFKELTGIELLTENQEFSNMSCKKCVENLELSLSIKRNFIRAQNVLTQSLVKIKSEDSEENCESAVNLETLIKEESENFQPEELFVDELPKLRSQKSKNIQQKKTYSVKRKKQKEDPEDLENRTCKTCNKTCSSTQAYRSHLRWHKIKHIPKNTPKIVCSICGLEMLKYSLEDHMKNVHLRQKNFICDICGRGFFKRHLIMTHLFVHLKIRPFECQEPNCKATFVSRDHLKQHERMKHKGCQDKVCHLCGKNFKIQIYLETHIRAKHTGEKPFVCSEIIPETNEKCKRAFHSNYELASHFKRAHTEEYNIPSTCPICFKVQKNETLLKMHLNLHTTKYVCDFVLENGEICNKRFISDSSRRLHLNLKHRKVKNFFCPLCGVPFRIKLDMELHLLNTHEGRKIQCEICRTLLGSKQYYRRHITNSHTNIDPDTRDRLLQKITKSSLDELFNHRRE